MIAISEKMYFLYSSLSDLFFNAVSFLQTMWFYIILHVL